MPPNLLVMLHGFRNTPARWITIWPPLLAATVYCNRPRPAPAMVQSGTHKR